MYNTIMGRIGGLDYHTPNRPRPRNGSHAGELVCFFKLVCYLTLAAAVSCIVSLLVSVIIDHFMR